MNFNGKRILILEGYAKQCLPLIRAFRKLGCEVSVLCGSRLDVAYASRYTSHKILGVCDRDKEDQTLNQIRELLKTGKFDVVVPTVDFSASLLSKNKEEFSRYCHVVANDWSVYEMAGNKEKTMEVCMENGIPCPKTILNVKSVDDIVSSGIQYPVVMKPKIGYGAIGFKRIDSEDELKKLLLRTKEDIGNYVFQEFIPQNDLQYECAMFIDNDNQVKTGVVFSKNRWFPVNGGSSTLNITVERLDIIESCAKLLKIINWRGPADIDLIQDPRDGVAKIMEINPRVSGSVKITFMAGTDQARQMLELVYNEEVTEYKTYKLDQRLRCSQTDFLWFLKSKNRFKAKPSYFNRRHTKDQLFSWADPMPWFAFSIQKLFSYKKEMKKRR